MASFSWAYSSMTMSTCLIFPPKTARYHRQRDMVAYFLIAPTAWFQGGTGEDSACPSVTSYWCFMEGFYPTVFEHRTPLRKPLSRPSASNHKFLSNSSWGARQSQWCPNSGTNLANFLRYGFWENEFEVWIYHPLWRLWPTWPWVFNDIPTKFQHSSYLIGSEDEHSRKLWKT